MILCDLQGFTGYNLDVGKVNVHVSKVLRVLHVQEVLTNFVR